MSAEVCCLEGILFCLLLCSWSSFWAGLSASCELAVLSVVTIELLQWESYALKYATKWCILISNKRILHYVQLLVSATFGYHDLGVTVHRCLQGKAPQYLVNCCHPTSDVASRQQLRSSSRHHLVVPRHRHSTLGHRALSIAGPMAWNALPNNLRDPSLSADNFRKTLKTHLFRNALEDLAH